MKENKKYFSQFATLNSNCNEFHIHDKLFMIMVQQVAKLWNITLNLSEYVPQLSTSWWDIQLSRLFA